VENQVEEEKRNSRNFKILITIILIIFISGIFYLQNSKISGAKDIRLVKDKAINVAENEVCSDPAHKFSCNSGYTCAIYDKYSREYKSIFNAKLEIGKCVKNDLVIDLENKSN